MDNSDKHHSLEADSRTCTVYIFIGDVNSRIKYIFGIFDNDIK